jgi:hypothetical protein
MRWRSGPGSRLADVEEPDPGPLGLGHCQGCVDGPGGGVGGVDVAAGFAAEPPPVTGGQFRGARMQLLRTSSPAWRTARERTRSARWADHGQLVAMDCPAAVAASGGGPAGHLAAYCAASQGCRSVWYRPQCERPR